MGFIIIEQLFTKKTFCIRVIKEDNQKNMFICLHTVQREGEEYFTVNVKTFVRKGGGVTPVHTIWRTVLLEFKYFRERGCGRQVLKHIWNFFLLCLGQSKKSEDDKNTVNCRRWLSWRLQIEKQMKAIKTEKKIIWKQLTNVKNGWKWLKTVKAIENIWKQFTWLKTNGNSWKWLKMCEKSWNCGKG